MSQSADDIPDAIQWHEGMMLAPQHFQVSGRRQEQLHAYHAERLQPYYWGIRSVDFDEVLVVEGACRVLSLDAVLPDGTPVAHTSEEETDLEVDLSDHADEAKEAPVTVHVALPTRAASERESTPDRYRSVEGNQVVDRTTGSRPIRIPRRAPRLRLLVADAPPSQYVTLPIAKVENTEDGFALTDYVPPRLDVPLDSGIGDVCQSLFERIRRKARSLSERLRSPAVEPGSVSEMEGKQKIHALTAELPRLEAQLRSERVHPFTLYQGLCRMAGDVARLTRRMVSPTFSEYDHAALRSCFGEVVSYIVRAVSEGIQETYAPVRFRKTDEGFALEFEERWQETDLVLGIRGRTDQQKEELRRWGENCLIGAASRIGTMRERRILGVDRAPIERAGDLVPGRNAVLFRLDADSEFIEPGSDLVVRRGEERESQDRPLELTLYVKEEEGQE
ncbi:MAG: type VI secretion system baseplate subunit TssK [Candidatus Bipolaricaulia bacterium]